MLKKLRNLRLVLLFVNYLICLYELGVFGFFEGIQIEGVYKTLIIVTVSVLIALSGLILTYFGKDGLVRTYIIPLLITPPFL